MTEAERKRRNADKSRRWREADPARSRAISKRSRAKHPRVRTPEQIEGQRQWRLKNKVRISAYNKRWTAANRPRKMKNNARWQKKKLATDPRFRLTNYLRNRVNTAIRKARTEKAAGTIALIGCDVRFLMGYIEARFKRGMSWSNYGKVWEIDHRIPLASYDLTDPSHQRSAFNYTNLQPLFSKENNSKGAKMPPPHQAELL